MLAGNDDRRVTYVVDRDLVRFAKFAAAVLAIFFVFGAYAFGFKLEVAIEHARELQKDISTLGPELQRARSDLDKARQNLEKSRSSAELLTREMEELRSRAKNKIGEIEAYWISFQQKLTPEQQVTAATAATALGVSPRLIPKLWPNHGALTVGFMDGDPAVIARVKRYMEEWVANTGLTIHYADPSDASVRVSFARAGSWSTVGTDALGVSKAQPTLNFGWLRPSTDENELRRVVLHEFGHTLGLVEEMNNPNAEIPWDRQAVVSALQGPPNNWSRSRIEQTLFSKVSSVEYRNYRPFDLTSIMMFPVRPEWTKGKLTVGFNDQLSAGDREFVARLYPK